MHNVELLRVAQGKSSTLAKCEGGWEALYLSYPTLRQAREEHDREIKEDQNDD